MMHVQDGVQKERKKKHFEVSCLKIKSSIRSLPLPQSSSSEPETNNYELGMGETFNDLATSQCLPLPPTILNALSLSWQDGGFFETIAGEQPPQVTLCVTLCTKHAAELAQCQSSWKTKNEWEEKMEKDAVRVMWGHCGGNHYHHSNYIFPFLSIYVLLELWHCSFYD